jgi:hypothetical protein
MKFLFSIILLVIGTNCFSQDNHFDTQRILLCNDSTRITINVEVIKSAGNDNTSNTIFYLIPKEDTSYNNIFENKGMQYNDKLVAFNKVKIIFSFNGEIITLNKIESLTNYIQKFIFDTLKKEQPSIFARSNLFYAVNDGAIIALNMALQNPEKINKTALYFTNYQPLASIVKEINNNAAKLKGKLFVFTNNEEDKLVEVDEMMATLALKSTAMFYKIDAFEAAINNADTLGYSWLVADGNNIILKTDY